MAKGDLILVKMASGSFQPASGIEVIATMLTNSSANGEATYSMYDGAIQGYVTVVPAAGADMSYVKIPLTNTLYIQSNVASVLGGVQVK